MAHPLFNRNTSRRLLVAAFVASLCAGGLFAQQTRTIGNLIGRADNSLNLYVRAAAAGAAGQSSAIGNLTGRTDANLNLYVVFDPTVTQAIGPTAVTVDNIVVTSTDGLTIQNTTAATVGVQTQYSPRQKFCGSAWKSNATAVSETDCWLIEVRPVPGAAATTSSLWFARSLAGGAYVDEMQLRNDGTLFVPNSAINSAGLIIAAGGNMSWGGRTIVTPAADGGLNFTTAAGAGSSAGIQDTFGADVTVNTCGTGTVTTGSKNAAGNITATGATACTVVFNGAPTFTNKPFCIAVPETGTQPTLIVNTTVSFTVTGLTSGAAFNYLCRGRL